MQDLRNGFATPLVVDRGLVRPWPLDVDQLDTGDQVLVRHAGENVVYENPAALLDAMLAASHRFERAVAIEAFKALHADRLARRRRFCNGLFLAAIFAPLALAVLL